MSKLLTPILLLLMLFACSTLPPEQSVIQEITTLTQQELLRNCNISLYAEYVDTGRKIIDINSSILMPPGSNMKLLTSAAALHILGPDYHFKTYIYYDGEIIGNRLTGNVYIVGQGDPSLGCHWFKPGLSLDDFYTMIHKQLINRGITIIKGGIVADNLFFPHTGLPVGWDAEESGRSYAATSNAICLNENSYEIIVKAGKQAGTQALIVRLEPEIVGLNLINNLRSGPEKSLFYYDVKRLENSDDTLLLGNIPTDGKEYSIKAAIPDPALALAGLVTDNLKTRSIEINRVPKKLSTKIEYNQQKVLLCLDSPPLKDIVYILNKRSINLIAEQLCIILGYETSGQATTKAGIKAIKKFLNSLSIDTDVVHIFDGSGLSRNTRLTTKTMVKLLAKITQKSVFPYFYNSLGIASVVEDIGFFYDWGMDTILAHNARLKSGTLDGAKALSGYITPRCGRLMAFSLLIDNFYGDKERLKEIQMNIMLQLAQME